jgi:ankyrin repeat protein
VEVNAVSRKLFVLLSIFLGLWPLCFCEVPRERCDSLLEAARKGDLKKVLTLLEKGADVNCRGDHQYTPLLVAARYGRIDIAQALCERGADVNAAADVDFREEEWGYTPLIWAASNCHFDMAELLINKGAAVGQKGRGGDLPLIIAARRGCLPLVEMLISKGAAVDAEDEESSDTALIETVGRGHLDIAEYLIEKGADTRRKSQGRKSLLMLAAYRGHFAGVRYFHEKGFAVNEPDNLGLTAMHYAASDRVESRYILEYLIQHGGNISGKDSVGTSPLMIASTNGASNAAKILIMNGAAVQEADRDGRTPLHYACRGIRDYLSENAAKWEATILLLLDKEAHVNARDIEGKSPLMETAHNDVPRIVELLLTRGALVNARDDKGWTALMHAAYWNQTAVIKVLAQRGADLNLRNGKGETALGVAMKRAATAQAYELLKSLGATD